MRLKEYRLGRKMTQDEVASHLGIPVKTYQNYERHVRQPDLDILCSLADFYDISLDEICGRQCVTNDGYAPNTESVMGDGITRLFEERRVNVSECSRRTGIPYGTLYDIAKGKILFERVSVGYAVRIANAFGITADELIGNAELDPDRYELCKIYDEMGTSGRKAILACARGLISTLYPTE